MPPALKGLLQFEDTAQRLYQCDGLSWKPWITDSTGETKCSFGWTLHDGYCYILISEQKATWITAARACREQYHATLVDVFSKGQMQWLWNFSGRKSFWIGLNDRVHNGRWEWSKGETVNFTYWKRSPPGSTRKGKHCVLAQKRGKWAAKDCQKGKGHNYVCSKKL
ncbi:hypothetical protein GDO86_001373 [Hymenochirus boettgeri]|uniref:FRAS1-related extracellular matrix protein 1 n=1 Tax=Hymenochirus boettgeri TaxID=247094 RepID=A0A8T2KCE6_9PIPI|nr:hypothetical protein GDO86_001373 [Hymenochirus boettgeri]